ncbi:hypothetical protein Taro_050154, partial [Colocasia esculenta]|nr:hypothetical protein [Colocasia esculenta]
GAGASVPSVTPVTGGAGASVPSVTPVTGGVGASVPSITPVTGGAGASVPSGKYRFRRPADEIVARHEIVLGREAKYREVFERTHKKKGTDLYVSTRSQEVVEAYMRQITDKNGEDINQEPVIDCEAWIAAAGPAEERSGLRLWGELG